MSYGGMVHTDYMTSMLVLEGKLRDAKVGLSYATIKCESLVSRGRNGAVALFMQSGASHLLFVDTDLNFDPDAILKMLSLNVGVVGGSYPKKGKDNSKYGLSFANSGRLVKTKVDKVYKADYLPGGFLLIKRETIEKLQQSHHVAKYKNQLSMYSVSDKVDEYHYDIFPCPIVNEIYLSEDYGFCHLCHLCEIPVFLYSDITFTHFANNFPFKGNLEEKLLMEPLNKNL